MEPRKYRYERYHIFVPILIVVGLVVYDLTFAVAPDVGRGWKEFIDDKRAINRYCSHYLAFISVLVGLLVSHLGELRERRVRVPILPFFISLLFASITMLFFPVPYDDSNVAPALVLWLIAVICEQIVVVFTGFGLLALLLQFLPPVVVDPEA